jgi:hypothetical protein
MLWSLARRVGGRAGQIILGMSLAACATPAELETYEIKRAQLWGDRTVAITYRSKGPMIAYFEPGPGKGGRLFIWDEGRTDVVVGKWYVKTGALGVCVTPNVYYKEMLFAPFEREACFEFNDNPLQFSHYKGDIFGLRDRTSVPYVSSLADTARIQEVLAGSSEYGPKPFGGEQLKPPRKPTAPPSVQPVPQ